MKKAILIQARLSSSRLPRKMLEKLGAYTLLEYVYLRCRESKKADDIIIVTSSDATDDDLYELCILKKIPVFRGDLENVFQRYLDCAKANNIDVICRVCGDSPFVDIDFVDKSFELFERKIKLEYTFVCDALNGFISEVFSLEVLEKLYKLELSKEDKEHVTKYIKEHVSRFDIVELKLGLKPKNLEKTTLTIDYLSDLLTAQTIVKKLNSFNFKSKEIIKILQEIKG